MEKKVKEITFVEHGDERGKLVVAESLKEIPFVVKRIFYIYGSDSTVVRGKHANKNSEFVLINLLGSCKIKTIDTKGEENVYELNKPNIGLYIPKMVWKEMYGFSCDSILLCLSNEYFNSGEYITKINDFINKEKVND